MMWALSHRTGPTKSLRVPQREVGEWTQRGTGTTVGHIFVYDCRCPSIFARMFLPDPPAGRLAHPEYRLNSSEAHCQSGRRPNGTYVECSDVRVQYKVPNDLSLHAIRLLGERVHNQILVLL